MLKEKAKYIAGRIRCIMYGIKAYGGKIYIGKNVNIKGGKG